MTDESEPQLFSTSALAVLDRQIFNPAVKSKFDYMSGGLWWTDEFPNLDSPEWEIIRPGYLYRFLLAYRASITLGEERIEVRPLWEQVAQHSPNWPGLRTERRGELALHRLQAALRVQSRCFAKLQAEMNAEK